jgi:hypothetical protein
VLADALMKKGMKRLLQKALLVWSVLADAVLWRKRHHGREQAGLAGISRE